MVGLSVLNRDNLKFDGQKPCVMIDELLYKDHLKFSGQTPFVVDELL